MHSSSLTSIKPFNLSKSGYQIHGVKDHPGEEFLSNFLDKFGKANTNLKSLEKRDPIYFTVCPTPIKQLIKTINAAYSEKMIAGKEIMSVRMQSMMAYIYDSYINKYGLLHVAERKLKELMLSVALHRSEYIKIELFARFLGISEIQYTADDLNFMFVIAQQLLQRISGAANIKRENAVFELVKETPLENVTEIIEDFMRKRVTDQEYLEIKQNIAEIVRDKEENSIDPDYVHKLLIGVYQNVKKRIQKMLIKKNVANQYAEYMDDFYAYKEYVKIMERFNWREGLNIDKIFDFYGTHVRAENFYEFVKKISLESVLSFVFHAQLNPKK